MVLRTASLSGEKLSCFRSGKIWIQEERSSVSEVEKFGFSGEVRFQRRRRLVSAAEKFQRRRRLVSGAEKLGFRGEVLSV
jgi:hypothetical protein